MWWCISLILAFGGQRQMDICVFKASLVYWVSFRTFRYVTKRNYVSKNQVYVCVYVHLHMYIPLYLSIEWYFIKIKVETDDFSNLSCFLPHNIQTFLNSWEGMFSLSGMYEHMWLMTCLPQLHLLLSSLRIYPAWFEDCIINFLGDVLEYQIIVSTQYVGPSPNEGQRGSPDLCA